MSLIVDEQGAPGPVYPGPSGITGATTGPAAAPASASYIVAVLASGLTQDRQLAAGANVTLTDGGPGGMLTIDAADAVAPPDTVDAPGQSASMGAVTIATAAPDGVYLIVATVDVSAAAAAGTLSAEAQYQNGGTQTATALTGFTLAATGRTAGSAPFHHTGGDITVTTTATGLIGTPTYEVKFRLIRLG